MLVDQDAALFLRRTTGQSRVKSVVDDLLGTADFGCLRLAYTAISTRASWPETSRDDRTVKYRARDHVLAASHSSFEAAVTLDQGVGGTVVRELGLRCTLQLGNYPLGKGFA